MGDRHYVHCVTCGVDVDGPSVPNVRWVEQLQQLIEALPRILRIRAELQDEYQVEIEFTALGVEGADSPGWNEHAEHELAVRVSYELEPMPWRPKRCPYCCSRDCGPELWAQQKKCCPDCTHGGYGGP